MSRLLCKKLAGSASAFRPLATVRCAPTAQMDDIPLCRNCAHFLNDETFRDNSEGRVRYGYCGLYSSLDVVSGERIYDYARLVRGDADKCGLLAKHYKETKGYAAADKKQ